MGGRQLVDTLARRASEAGAAAHFDARAVALIADPAPRVHGVVLRIDGRERFARARRGVILCAGGFALNDRMLRQYAPLAVRLAGDALSAGHDDGSGIELGLSVGAAAIHMDELFTTLPFWPPESHVRGILVNERGQRFINEDAYPGRVASYCTRQIGDRIFLLVDHASFAQPTELSRISVAAVGESWEEIERELGMVEGCLTHTVHLYNRHAAKGNDPLFHKGAKWLTPLEEPPFAALACHIGQAFYPFFTLGGLSVRPTGEVLTPAGEPIPGLYAAGRNCCGLPRWGEGYSSGMSLGDCTFFGRLAGRTAAGAARRIP
jgi:succinate dehydrogenase/fumarate reductase flavoprotein subunit